MRQLDEGLWVWEKSFSLLGVDIGNRMTVIELPDRRLFVHSPVALDDGARDAIRALGDVSWLVTPNRVHGLFVGDWLKAYPGARYFAAPGAPIKVQAFAEPLAECHAFHWAGNIDLAFIDGVPKLNEFAFLHRPSGTLVLTDLVFNLPKNTAWWPQVMLRASGSFGTFGPSRMLRGMIEDEEVFRASLHKILSWDFDRVVMSHGVVAMSHGKALMANAFADYLSLSTPWFTPIGVRANARCG